MHVLDKEKTLELDEGGSKVLMGVRLTFPKTFNKPQEAAEYIQEYYFDELCGSGLHE